MKVIETGGITYLERFSESTEWYWGTDWACGDLYEAEEVYLNGKRFEPNRLIFVHHPDGTVFEPIQAKENQYFGTPAYVDGIIYILLVHFDEKRIRVMQCSERMESLSLLVEIPLGEVKDCYNLMVSGSPVMVTRQGSENHFQVIWPDKVDFPIGNRESFYMKQDGKLFFSEWNEAEGYEEWVNVRAYPSGDFMEKIPGTLMRTSDRENWILQ